MKKLFAIVLTIAMALAIAAPAMAAGWDKVEITPVYSQITVEFDGLNTRQVYDPLTLGYWTALTEFYPVVKGTEIHFYAKVSIPAAAKLTPAELALLTNKGLDVAVAISNVQNTTKVNVLVYEGTNLVATGNDTAAVTYDAAKNIARYTTSLNEKNCGQTVYFDFVTNAASGGVDTKASLAVGYHNKWDGEVMRIDIDADGLDEWIVFHNDVVVTVEKDLTGWAAGTKQYGLQIPLKAQNQVDTSAPWYVTVAGVKYQIIKSADNTLTFQDAAGVITDGVANGAKAAFDEVFPLVNGYEGAKYITKANFTEAYGTIAEQTAVLTWPAGYVTVTNPNAQPPQTGDATTVVGFVMIALAVVAAAVVTVKKVRA